MHIRSNLHLKYLLKLCAEKYIEMSARSIMQAQTLFLYSSSLCRINIAAEFICSVLLRTVSHESGILLAHIIVELYSCKKIATMGKGKYFSRTSQLSAHIAAVPLHYI